MTLDATNPPPIERRSLHSELVDRLRSLIVEGRFPPTPRSPNANCAKPSASRARRCARR